MIGTIAFGLAILLVGLAGWGLGLCLWAQRKNPSAPLPIGGVVGFLGLATVVCSVVVVVGAY